MKFVLPSNLSYWNLVPWCVFTNSRTLKMFARCSQARVLQSGK